MAVKKKTKKTNTSSYVKNVLKSAKYISVQTLKGVDDELTDFITDSIDLGKDAIDGIKNFKSVIKGKIDSILGENAFDSIKDIKNNALEDLRTGKFYNEEREGASADKMAAAMGLEFNFDDFDFDLNDDGDFDTSEEEQSNEEPSQSDTIGAIVDRVSFSQQKSSLTSAGIIAQNATGNTKISLSHTTKLFGIVNNSLASINGSILGLHNDIAGPLNTFITNSSNFYQTATEELAKQTSYLENMNKLITDKFTSGGEGGSSDSGSAWDKIMGNGLPNLRELASTVKNKAFENSVLGMFSGMLSPEMIKMLTSGGIGSPIAALLTSIIPDIIRGTATGKAVNRFTKTLKTSFYQTAFNIHEYNQRNEGGILGFLAKVFDITPSDKAGKLDFSKYNKGRADWTGKDSKALQDVIPTQLAKIISILSGKDALIFDYEKGTWKSATKIKSEFSEERIAKFGDAGSSLKDEIVDEFIKEDKIANKDTNKPVYTKNSRAVRSLSRDYDMLVSLLATQGESIVGFTRASELVRYCNYRGWTRSTPPLLDPVNLKTIARIIFKKRPRRTSLEGAIYSGRMNDIRFMNANSAGTTISNVLNKSNLDKVDKLDMLSTNEALSKYVDKENHDILYYLSNISTTVLDIKNNVHGSGNGEIISIAPINAEPKKPHGPLTAAELRKIKAMLNKHATVDEIANKLNRSKKTIADIIKSGDIDKRIKDAGNKEKAAKIKRGEITPKVRAPRTIPISRDIIEEYLIPSTDNRVTDEDPEGRFEYDPKTESYYRIATEDISATDAYKRTRSRATKENEDKNKNKHDDDDIFDEDGNKKEKHTILSSAIDGISDFIEKLAFGEVSEAVKDEYYDAGGLFGMIQDLPRLFGEFSEKVKDKIQKKWKEFKQSNFGQRYGKRIKDVTKNNAEEAVNDISSAAEAAGITTSGITVQETLPTATPPIAETTTGSGENNSSGTNARGGMVTKSGIASISEGEIIIPAKYNPLYKGKMTNSERARIEKRNLASYRNILGSFGEGTTSAGTNNKPVPQDIQRIFDWFDKKAQEEGTTENQNKKGWRPLNNAEIKEIVRLSQVEGLSDKEIAKKMHRKESTIAAVTDPDNIQKLKDSASVNDKVTKMQNAKEKFKTKVKNIAEKGKNIFNTVSDHLLTDENNTPNSGAEKRKTLKEGIKSALDTVKEHAPEALADGTIGAIIGGVATGSGLGLLGGFAVGAGSYLLRNSDTICKKLFGEDALEQDDKGNYKNKIVNFIRNKLPKTARAAVMGGIAGMLGAPGGILGGMVIGAGLQLVSSTNTFKDLILGHEDTNGKRTGGLVGSIKVNVINPLVEYTKGGLTKITKFFKEEVFKPIGGIATGLKDWIFGLGNRIATAVSDKAKDLVKRTLGQKFDEIFGKATRTVGKVGKFGVGLAKNVISKPAQLIEKNIKVHNIKAGYSNMTPAERLAYGYNLNTGMDSMPMNVIRGLARSAYEKIIDPLANTVKSIKDKLKSLWKNAKNLLKKYILSPLANIAKSLWEKLKESFLGKAAKKIKDFVKDKVFDPITKFFKNTVKKTFTDIKNKMVKDFKNAVGTVKEKGKKIWGKVKDKLEYYNEKGKRNINSKYTDWAGAKGRTDEELQDAYKYLSGKKSVKKERTKLRQDLSDTITATLPNSGNGDPDTIKEITRLFNTKEVKDNDDYDVIRNKVRELTKAGKLGTAESKLILSKITETRKAIKKNRKTETNFDTEQQSFFEKAGFAGMSKRDLRKARIQAGIDVKNLEKRKKDEEATKQQAAKALDEKKKLIQNNRMKQEEEQPLDKDRNDLLTGIKTLVKDIKDKIQAKQNSNNDSNNNQSNDSNNQQNSNNQQQSTDNNTNTAQDTNEEILPNNQQDSNDLTVPDEINEAENSKPKGSGLFGKLKDKAFGKINDAKSTISKLLSGEPVTIDGYGTIQLNPEILNALSSQGITNDFTNTHGNAPHGIRGLVNKFSSNIKDLISGKPVTINGYGTIQRRSALSQSTIPMDENGNIIGAAPTNASNAVNNLLPASNGSSFERLPEAPNGTTRTITVEGIPVEQVYRDGEWNNVGSDASTDLAEQMVNTKHKFYDMFVNGGLLKSMNNLLNPEANEESGNAESTESPIAKIFNSAKGFLQNLFGSDGIFGQILGALGGTAGIGGILTSVLPGILAALGIGKLLAKIGESSAGTSYDSGMYEGADAEARKEEVANSSTLTKAKLGMDSIENRIRGRDTTTYKKDDYVTEYTSSRIAKRAATTAAVSLMSPKFAKATVTVAKYTVGKVPVAGKLATLTTKIFAKVSKIFSIALEKLGVKCSEKLATEAAENVSTGIAKAALNAGADASEVVPIVGWIIWGVQIADAILSGIQSSRAKTILGILDEPTIPQRVLAGICNGINYAIPLVGGIIPTETIFSLVYSALKAIGIDFGNFEEQRARAKAEVEEYNQLNGTTYNLEEYIHNVYGEYTVQEKLAKTIKSGASKLWEGTKNVASKVGTGIKNAASSIKTGVSKAWEGTKNVVSKVGSGIKTVASKAWEGTKNVVSKVGNTVSTVWKSTAAGKLVEGTKSLVSAIKAKKETGVDYIKEGKDAIQTMLNKIEDAYHDTSKTFKDMTDIQVEVSDENPLKGIIQTLATVAKVINIPMLYIKNTGKTIYRKMIKPIIEGVKGVFTNVVNSRKTTLGFMIKGDVKGLWAMDTDADVDQSNPLKIISTVEDFINKMVYTIPTGFIWIGKGIWKNIITPVAKGAKQVFTNIGNSKITAGKYMIKGDVAGLWKMDSDADVDQSNPLKIVSTISDLINKFSYTIPTGFIWIGRNIKSIFTGIINGAKQVFTNIGNSKITAGKYMIKGDVAGLWKMDSDSEIDQSNPLKIVSTISDLINKFSYTIPTAFIWAGKGIWKNIITPVAKGAKQVFTNIGNSKITAGKYMIKGDIKGLWAMDSDADVDQSNPLKIVSTISDLINKFSYTIPTGFIWIGKGIWKNIITPVAKGAKQVLENIGNSKITAGKYMIKGDIKGLWKMDSDSEIDQSNPLKIVSTISDLINKFSYTVPTGLIWAGRNIKSVFTGIINGAKQVFTNVVNSRKTAQKFVEAGDLKGLWAMDSDANLENNPMGFVSTIADGIFKVVDTIPTALNWIGKKVKETISGIGTWISNLFNDLMTGWKNATVDPDYVPHYTEETGSASKIHTSQKGNFRKFGNTNIDQNGCGPAVASTVLKAFGKNVGINTAAEYAEANNYVAGASKVTGTKASYFADILGSHGIKTDYTNSTSDINSSIKSGKPTILLGQDSNNKSKSNSPFGPNPHYVVARGIDKNGNIIIDDPELSNTTIYNKNILKKTKLGIITGGDSEVEETDASSDILNIGTTLITQTMGKVISKFGSDSAIGKLLSYIFGTSAEESEKTETDSDEETTTSTEILPGNGIFSQVTSLTNIGDKYAYLYNTSKNNGISKCITGSPINDKFNVLSNCVGWACARFNHIYNLLTGYDGIKYPKFNCDAKNFYTVALSYGLNIGDTPQVGAIMCWGPVGSDSRVHGHVAIVEEVISETKVRTSESSYASATPMFTKIREKGKDGNWGISGGKVFKGFIYNPGVEQYISEHQNDTSLSEFKEVAASGTNFNAFNSDITRITGISKSLYSGGDSKLINLIKDSSTKKNYMIGKYTGKDADALNAQADKLLENDQPIDLSKPENRKQLKGSGSTNKQYYDESKFSSFKRLDKETYGGASRTTTVSVNLDKVTGYLKAIAENTSNNTALPEIVKLLSDSMDIISEMNSSNKNSSDNITNISENAQDNIDNSIRLMRARIESISKTL